MPPPAPWVIRYRLHARRRIVSCNDGLVVGVIAKRI